MLSCYVIANFLYKLAIEILKYMQKDLSIMSIKANEDQRICQIPCKDEISKQ